MTRLPWLRWLDASVTIRMAFAVLTALIAVLTPEPLADVLPWLVLVAVLDMVVVTLDRMPVARRGVVNSLAMSLLALSAAAAGAAFALEGNSAALLILIPAYHAGTRYGRFGFLLTSAVGGGSYLLAVWIFDPEGGVQGVMLAWLAAASLLGILGAWNQRLAAEQGTTEADPAAREAIELIERLHDLSSQMSTGLDALASATLALDLLAARVPSTRSAVLVTHDTQHLVPVALRGSTRAPWSVAEQVTQVLSLGPSRWAPTEVTFTDDLGPRRALVAPCALGNGSATVLVADRPDGQPFSREELHVAGKVTRRVAPTIQAGLLFGELRQVASIEERDRIARDIHDGIAQELAALGYRVDALRAQAGPPGTSMRDNLDGLRQQLGDVMADLRLNITDLRVAERPGSGLGAVLGAAVQSFGSVTGMRTTVTVSERQRRLDPRVEILVHRLVMDVLADAQASHARNAWVTLTASVAGPTSVVQA
ncbi:sensor histidine kinase [Fodinibacter luteus]|uniref:sensor histidine kinase n=1 Tax=Fodinibacter luteus TaxID=552064 RepID=UPI0031E605F8